VNRFLIAMVLGAAAISQAFSATWTHVIYLVGEQDYRRDRQDQSWVLYKNAVHAAREDKRNNYVIYFDPYGSGGFLLRNRVRLYVYLKGKKAFTWGWDHNELDSTAESSFDLIRDALAKTKAPENETSEPWSLFLYGEHLGIYENAVFDGSSTQGTTLPKLLQELSSLSPGHRFSVALFQMCYLNSADFLTTAMGAADRVLLAPNGVSNTAWDLAALFQGTENPEGLASRAQEIWSGQAPHAKLELYRAGEWAGLTEKISEIERRFGNQIWEDSLIHPQWQNSLLADFPHGRYFESTHEMFIPLLTGLDLYRGIAPETDLREVEQEVARLDPEGLLNQIVQPRKFSEK
jgi:hypothetical protein